MLSSAVPFCSSCSPPPLLKFRSIQPLKNFNFTAPVLLPRVTPKPLAFDVNHCKKLCNVSVSAATVETWRLRRRFGYFTTAATSGGDDSVSELDDNVRRFLRALLWIAAAVYILWLFLLPYAPGDPVWAISSETVSSLIGLSLNFFFILPFCNSGNITPPVVSEGLFNFVIGWTVMFGPLLYTDKWREKFKGSLDVLWGCQLFLTNTFLIPYMAIRLNEVNGEYTPHKTSKLGSFMKEGGPVVALVGALGCFVSIVWAFYGRGDANFGEIPERWEFLLSYVQTERVAYAFIWDICLYLIFQPWLIGDNLKNIQPDKVSVVDVLRFVPVVGIIAYCLCLNTNSETYIRS